VARASNPSEESDIGLGQARARRWWVTGRRVGSLTRAAAFIDEVGFALLFPSPNVVAPSLWEAVAGDATEPFASGMGENEQRVWTWKDELPRRGDAWYGAFVGRRGSFLSPELLAALYPGQGGIDDHEALTLSPAAHEIAGALAGQPLPSDALRAFVGDRSRYQRAVVELQRNLLITTAGVQENRTGWPSALLELTCRRFDVGDRGDEDLAAKRFLQTMLAATPRELGRAFGWPVAQARSQLDTLVRTGFATSVGTNYLSAVTMCP
jgi:hypothetical protein